MNRIRRVTHVILMLGLLLSSSVWATDDPDSTAAQKQKLCAPYLSAAFTPPVLKGPLRPEQLRDCDEEALYYGIGRAADPAAALQCGYAQRAAGQGSLASMFRGPGVLSMLYANGLGVPRDLDLARRFVCENPWAALPEIEGRLADLDGRRRQAQGLTAARFDLCDTGTSGLSAGTCAGREERLSSARRAHDLILLQKNWSPAARHAFAPLQSAYAAFVESRSGKEVDMSGTARNMFYFEDRGRQEEQLLINLRSFARNDFPQAGAADAAAANTEMADRLVQLRAAATDGAQFGTITIQGIEQTQAAWLQARQAWLDFAAVAWPKLSQDRVRWRLTRQRIGQLKGLERFTQ